MLKTYTLTKALIKKEISNLKKYEWYYGTEENNQNENWIFEWFIDNELVDQEWFDEKLNYTNIERLRELLIILELFESSFLKTKKIIEETL